MSLGSDIVEKFEDYINGILSKLDFIDDKELKDSIYRLIYERNKLIEMINLDVLTDTYNRRILDSIDKFSIVVICDIDDFKFINDSYGHMAGDKVLKVVSKVLKNNCNTEDVVCRYGGDEFLVIFKNCSISLAYEKINNISHILNNYFKYSKINVSFSAGISCYEDGKSLEKAIKEADVSLYEVKRNGKSGIGVYNNSDYKRLYK